MFQPGPTAVAGELDGQGRRQRHRLTMREQDVLRLMAEGRSNAAIADHLVISRGAVEKHVANIFLKLGLPASGDDNRRVLAVLRYLQSWPRLASSPGA